MTSKSKITHILYSGLGGHGSVVFSYLQEPFLSEINHHILFFGIEDLNPDYIAKCNEKSLGFSYIKKISGIKYIKDFINSLRDEKPVIIITHSLSTIPLLLFYGLFNETKVILVEHASIDIKRRSDYLWTILGLLFCKKIVYLTQVEYNESKSKFKYFFKPSKISIISNGVDLNKFTPKLKHSVDKVTIVKHCRFSASKDLETLINGFSILMKMSVSKPVELKLAGDGPVLDKLRLMVEELDLSNEIHFLGLLKEDEIIDLLNNSEIYVNSSKAETLSTSIIQAMACGLACAVSDIAENKNLIKEKENGRIFEVSNPEDLARVLFELSQDSEQRQYLGLKARNYIESHFSSDLMIRKYQCLADELL